jgi:hypothetical protein
MSMGTMAFPLVCAGIFASDRTLLSMGRAGSGLRHTNSSRHQAKRLNHSRSFSLAWLPTNCADVCHGLASAVESLRHGAAGAEKLYATPLAIM